MIRRPPRSTRTDTLFPYTTLFRSLGFSTVVGAFLYWWISQHKATKGIVVTHKADATNALFDMTKRYHAEVPDFLRPSTVRANSKELKRSEERRVGKECVSTCRSRVSPDH